MARPRIIIPPINPLRFYPQVAAGSSPHLAFDSLSQADGLLPWQRRLNCPYYLQPWRSSDKTGLQIALPQTLGTGTNGVYLELWEVQPSGLQTRVAIQPGLNPQKYFPDLSDTFAGDSYVDETSNTINLRRHQWNIDFFELFDVYSYAPSPFYTYYWVLIVPAFGTWAARAMQSEPFVFRPSSQVNDPTLYIAYTHLVNDLGVFWEMAPTFGFRVDGFRDLLQVDANTSTYEDQTVALRQLDRRSKRIFPFVFGGNDDLIVAWVLDRLNRIFDCEDVRIAGTRYLLDEGAKPEVDLPLAHGVQFSVTVNMREYDPEAAGVFI